MNLRGLSFDAMPPLAVPFQFFITAPLFIVAVGLIWLFANPVELASRWSMLMLASTHAVTLGFMLMVMAGALFQVLPVVTGIAMPQTKILSRLIHLFLLLGVVCLLAGFISSNYYLLSIGGLAIVVALSLFISGFLICLPQMRNSPTSWAIRLAFLALLITIFLGVTFIIAWLQPSWFPGFRSWTNIHILWGIIGWTLLLVMGVSFQLIPMFYVTADYPKWLSHFLPAILFIEMTLLSVLHLLLPIESNSRVKLLLLVAITVTTAVYALYTLYLLKQRKRKVVDVTLWFWNTAMISLLVAAGLFLVILFYQGQYSMQLELIMATTGLVGFAMALITGMLLKIVPFLVWLNLQQKWIKHPATKMPLSNMQQVIPINIARHQFLLFITTFPVVIVAVTELGNLLIIKTAAVLLIATYGYLFINLKKAHRLYKQLDGQLDNTQLAESQK